MSDTDTTTTEKLIRDLDRNAYAWGRHDTMTEIIPDGVSSSVRADRDERKDAAIRTRMELLQRIAEKKRALDAGLERERELRETVADLRVALQHDQNQRTAAENRAESAEARVTELEADLLEAVKRNTDLNCKRVMIESQRSTARAEAERLRETLDNVARIEQSIRPQDPRQLDNLGIAPRVLNVDELREGQAVAALIVHGDDSAPEWHACTVIANPVYTGGALWIHGRGTQAPADRYDALVLLPEALEEGATG